MKYILLLIFHIPGYLRPIQKIHAKHAVKNWAKNSTKGSLEHIDKEQIEHETERAFTIAKALGLYDVVDVNEILFRKKIKSVATINSKYLPLSTFGF